jgi:Flp pilus assembly protein TadD
LAGALLVLEVLAVYSNSLNGPFVFDDVPSIVENESIRQLGTALTPPGGVGETVAGRPVLNLSFALNYAAGGLNVRGYHWVNLLIHATAGLMLFGLVRRTLRPRSGQTLLRPVLHEKWAPASTTVALAVALLWTLHPLQTESVTYVVQRAESLAGLFFLLTLYAFVHSVESGRPAVWQMLSVGACLLGMGTKEVMVAAPLLVLLYDRTFVAGGFAAAARQRWRFYLGLAATWLLLGWLVTSAGGRGSTAGLNTEITPWHYALTQCRAVITYLRLALWPFPLIFDYGTSVVKSPGEVWAQALAISLLAGGTLWALWRKPALGFLGACFFALLAPSSSFVPVATQTMAEHRMYLALVPVLVLIVAGLQMALGRKSAVVWLVMAAGYAGLTFGRNADFASEEVLWRDTAKRNPGSARAHSNLGVIALEAGRPEEAIAEYKVALRIAPDFSEARSNLGVALFQIGRAEEAVVQLTEAQRGSPTAFKTNYNLATALTQLGRLAEAVPLYEAALRVRPNDAQTHNNLGNVFFLARRWADAGQHYAAAIHFDPGNYQARNNMAAVMIELGGYAEARTQYQAALRLKPDYAKAREGLARLDRLQQAVPPTR